MAHPTNTARPHAQAGRTTLAVPALFLLAALVAGGVVLASRTTADEGAKTLHHRYIAVTGHGSSARAWYDGASPSGTTVQDALDAFAEEGFRIVDTTQSVDVSQGSLDRWTILLSK